MAIISGILINGAGQPLPNVQIVLTALKTSSKVLNQSKAFITTTSETGAYSINAQVGYYAVTVLRNGYSVEKVGCIKVYADSQNGTLNDYLLNPNESEISPEILAQIVEERKLTQQSASEAVKTLENSVKKTGEISQTVNGILDVTELKENGVRVYSPNNKPTANDVGALSTDGGTVTGDLTVRTLTALNYNKFYRITINQNNTMSHYITGVGGEATRLRWNTLNDTWNFENSSVTINNKPVLKQGDYNIGNTSTPLTTFTSLSQLSGIACGDHQLGIDSLGTLFPNSDYNYLYKFGARNRENGGAFLLKPYNNNKIYIGYNLTSTENVSWVELLTTAHTNVLKLGDYGLGSRSPLLPANTNLTWDACTTASRKYTLSGKYIGTPDDTKSWGGTLEITRRLYDTSTACVQVIKYQSRTYEREGDIISGKWVWSNWKEFITTANSTVDSNGFYKKASPIIRLFSNDDMEPVDGFEKSGCGLINSEANGVTATKIAVGHYEIHSSLGFAKEGWYITLPEDANGNKKLFAKYSTDENNVITIKTYTKKFDFAKCEIVAGEPQDITGGRWIDIRLEMPSVELS
ncbi:hypothetical protein GCM10023211_02460 [Orbus sasakiae]|uniref:Lambda-like tail fibre protein N-terminal domain-containing protein n=1 Tax=Orbus sasakiae TaxID=1078475 RepID=A0ABP9N4U7_9GAMM